QAGWLYSVACRSVLRDGLGVNSKDHTFALGKNWGVLLAFVSCSTPEAIFSSTGSLQARPKNESPAGKPKMNPAGTVISGYPATAAAFELPPPAWSPSTQSVIQARLPVGAMMASRWNLSINASIPSLRERR